MSTLTISPAFVSGNAQAPRLTRKSTVRLTQRGRIVVLLGALLLAVVVMMSLSGWATASLHSGAPEHTRTIEVQPGDTLYGLAAGIAEPGQIRDMVHQIQQLNSLPNADLTVGQKLALPVG
jgi:hypothetical protein